MTAQQQEQTGVVQISALHAIHIVQLHVQYVHIHNIITAIQEADVNLQEQTGAETMLMGGVLMKHAQIVHQNSTGTATQKTNAKQLVNSGAVTASSAQLIA